MTENRFGTLALDFDELTIDEIETLENITDRPFDELHKDGAKKAKTLKAMAFVAAKRIDPDVTLEEIGKLPLSSLNFGNDADEEADPKEA